MNVLVARFLDKKENFHCPSSNFSPESGYVHIGPWCFIKRKKRFQYGGFKHITEAESSNKDFHGLEAWPDDLTICINLIEQLKPTLQAISEVQYPVLA